MPSSQPLLLLRPASVIAERADSPIQCRESDRRSTQQLADFEAFEAELPGSPLPGWSLVTRKPCHRHSMSTSINADSPA